MSDHHDINYALQKEKDNIRGSKKPPSTSPAETVSEHITVPDVTTEGSLTVMTSIPPYFLEHDGRNLKAVTEAESGVYIENDLNMRRFAIGKLGEHRLRNKGEHVDLIAKFKKDGVASPGLFFAETLESDAGRLLTYDELTNNAVKADNYQFFLRNASVMKVNVAITK
ncbi:hypothetical protein MNB_SV-4-141 [hydrothermal vent metagenome]|uniref:Uncharacterized protein n=1 Tax=hydrothermal vent metagenome TaxID=652676 RepID=A0A1W1EB12_9ZZZZ